MILPCSVGSLSEDWRFHIFSCPFPLLFELLGTGIHCEREVQTAFCAESTPPHPRGDATNNHLKDAVTKLVQKEGCSSSRWMFCFEWLLFTLFPWSHEVCVWGGTFLFICFYLLSFTNVKIKLVVCSFGPKRCVFPYSYSSWPWEVPLFSA